jgi:methyltransferase (TIGR00027 family)
VKREQSSLTALGIAAFRALESERKQDEKICEDPYARKFVPTWFYYVAKFTMVTGYAEWRSPGVMGFLVTRSRYIDDYLSGGIRDGIEQLVILGSGFDSRPYRFEQLRGRVRVFEVDHPATQRIKKEKLVKIFGALPNHVTFVPVDFAEETLEKRLVESGYDKAAKTLFIMEGVTMYLNPEAMDSILSFVTGYSGSGSSLISDYMYKSVINGTEKHGEVISMRRNRLYSGEALMFGIEEGRIEDYLRERGFQQIHDVNHEELGRMYCTGENRSRRIASGYSIVSAIVVRQGRSRG